MIPKRTKLLFNAAKILGILPLKSSLVPTKGAGIATVTRATIGSVTDYSGLVRIVASGEPRFSIGNGAEATEKGILVEALATNLCIRSHEADTWSKEAGVSITANNVTAPDGTATADTMTTTGLGGIFKIPAGINGDMRAISIYIKKVDLDAVAFELTNQIESIFTKVTYTFSTDTFSNFSATTFTGLSCTSEVLPTGWVRLRIIGTAPASGSITGIGIFLRLASAGSVAIWGAQVAGMLSSYIPTAAASVTKNADVISWQTAGNVLANSGTVFIDVTPTFDIPSSSVAGYGKNWVLDFGSGIGLYVENQLLKFTDGTNTATAAWIPVRFVTYKLAASWGAMGLKVFVNGVSSSSAAFTGTLTLGANMTIGGTSAGTANNFGGFLKNLVTINKQLSDSYIQRKTT